MTVANLATGLKAVAQRRLQTGHTNRTLYIYLLKDVVPHLDGPARYLDLKMDDRPQIGHLLKIRYGQFWNTRRAFELSMPCFRRGAAQSHFGCPLCSGADSNSHMLGECQVQDMKSMYIEQHNATMRLILAILGSSLRQCQQWY